MKEIHSIIVIIHQNSNFRDLNEEYAAEYERRKNVEQPGNEIKSLAKKNLTH